MWVVWKTLGWEGLGKKGSERGAAVEDTVSFSGGMSSYVFLFGEAAHSSQKLAGNHILLTLGPIRRRRRRRREEGRKRRSGVVMGREGGKQGCFSKRLGR